MSLHRLFATILMLACALVQAQTRRPPRKPAPKPAETAAPADPSTWPLESFTVKGNSHYTREQILALSGLRIGHTVAKADFDAARDRIVGSGAALRIPCQVRRRLGDSGRHSAERDARRGSRTGL